MHILCRDVITSVQWNITGMQKEYNNSRNPVCLGPVSSTDNGATVECEAVGHESLSTRLLVGKIRVCVETIAFMHICFIYTCSLGM